MASRWRSADEAGSRALNDALGEPVSFRPMRPKKGGQRVTIDPAKNTSSHEPDPSREKRPRPNETGFVCVTSWKSGFMDAASGGSDPQRDALAVNDVLLDFDRRLFLDQSGVERLPQIGDLFDLPAEDGETITVQMAREPYDDGNVRIAIICYAPE